MTTKPPGKIITFYSYKGGTGRSMALANTAWVLASNGKRVLVVDWDLEAPGLHRFFHPFLEDKQLTNSEGVIDFVMNCAAEAMTPAKNPGEKPPDDWYVPHANILRYAFALEWEKFRPPGTLDFVPAGKQGPSYSDHVNAFNWKTFYNKLGGGRFIEAAKVWMKDNYDYILIDSRTGVSDTSGICTVQLPDILVLCFTLNSQGIEGTAAVAEAVDTKRRKLGGDLDFRIYPIPMRVERFEKDKLEMALEIAKNRFEEYLWHIEPEKQNPYWGHVEVFYEPFYAYEEILACFGDEPLQTTSLLASIERITSYLTDQTVTQLQPVADYERRRVLSQYARQRKMPTPASISPVAEFLFYLSYAKDDLDEYLAKFYVDLSAEIRSRLELSAEPIGFFDSVTAVSGEQWPELADYAIQRSRVLVPLYSSSYFHSESCGKEFQYFLERKTGRFDVKVPAQILPVIWDPPKPPVWKTALDFATGDSSFPKTYNAEGLHGMIKSEKRESDYRKFIARFADLLIKAAKAQTLPERSNFYSLKNLPSAFGDIAALEITLKGWNGLLRRYQKDHLGDEYHWTDNEGDVGFLKDVDAMNALVEPFLLSPDSFVNLPLELEDVATRLETLLQKIHVFSGKVDENNLPKDSYVGFSAAPYPYFQVEVDFVDSAASVLRLVCNVDELFILQQQLIPKSLENLMQRVASLAVDFLLAARIEDDSGTRWSGFSRKVERAEGFANLFFTNCAALALHRALHSPRVKGWVAKEQKHIESTLSKVTTWIALQYDSATNGFWMDEARTQTQTMGVLYALEVLYTIEESLPETLLENCAKALMAVVEKMTELAKASALQTDFFHTLPLPGGEQGAIFYDDRRYIGAFLSLFTLAKSRDRRISSDALVHARNVLFQGVSDEWVDEPSNLWDDGRPLICFSQDALLGLVNYTLW